MSDPSPLVLGESTRPHIVLARHGETEWSRTGRHTGLSDIPLTENGRHQAEMAGVILGGRRFGAVLTSPLSRARDTAALAGYPDAVVDPDLVEWDYGGYEGLTTPEIAERLGGSWSIWTDGVIHGAETPGETIDDVRHRAGRVLARLAPVLERGDDALIFAHAHFLRIFASVWLDLPVAAERLYLGTGAVSALGHEHGTPVVVEWNMVAPR
ncbi:histidine phosphatase family protein [Herbiconiux sp. L3-i23]|jgi:broad specificity phosphatase PhoE|uniref:histidine phosphatase family protein n=1 Tax=Herbiconiux sp. L3-i23 TaxID=2905871 RepID=UPI0020698D58|nr:histidine phosphatase family protein [Herbiconiux sp. L3-i23]BDI22360.1 phosphatase [Herbiconiux sp. L3-i23]